MFIGGHRSREWGGVEPEGEFFLLNPSVTLPSPHLSPLFASSVEALLGRRETLSAALPHLGPNTHYGIVLTTRGQTGWVRRAGLREGYSRYGELGKDRWKWPRGWAGQGIGLRWVGVD